VVAEVPDDSAVQRREVGDHRGAVAGEYALQSSEDATVEGDAVRQGAVDIDAPAAGHKGGGGAPPDEREAAPAAAVVDGLEEETRFVTDDAQKRRDGRGEVGQNLPPHGDDRVAA